MERSKQLMNVANLRALEVYMPAVPTYTRKHVWISGNTWMVSQRWSAAKVFGLQRTTGVGVPNA